MNTLNSRVTVNQPPKLLDQLRQAAIEAGHSTHAANSMVEWNRRFILFFDKRHPQEMGVAEIGRFLQHVAHTQKEPLPALEASRTALDFLYKHILSACSVHRIRRFSRIGHRYLTGFNGERTPCFR